jgi:[protein-PII] uridylyltransferase
MTELQALRDAYRQHKAALLASLQAQGASTRGIHVLLRKFSRLADGLLTTLWQRAGLPPGLTLAAVGGFGREQLFPHSDIDVLVLLPTDLPAPDTVREQVEGLHPQLLGCRAGDRLQRAQRGRMPGEAANDVTVQTSLLEARRMCAATPPVCRLSTSLVHSSTHTPFWWPRRWRCASATPSTKTPLTHWSPTARNRPAACATCT